MRIGCKPTENTEMSYDLDVLAAEAILTHKKEGIKDINIKPST